MRAIHKFAELLGKVKDVGDSFAQWIFNSALTVVKCIQLSAVWLAVCIALFIFNPLIVTGLYGVGLVSAGKNLLFIAWFFSSVIMFVSLIICYLAGQMLKVVDQFDEKIDLSMIKTIDSAIQHIASAFGWISIVEFLAYLLPFEHHPKFLMVFMGFFLLAALLNMGWVLTPPRMIQWILNKAVLMGLVGLILFVARPLIGSVVSHVAPNLYVQYEGSADAASSGVSDTLDRFGASVLNWSKQKTEQATEFFGGDKADKLSEHPHATDKQQDNDDNTYESDSDDEFQKQLDAALHD